jgi:hypothetical protein
MFRPVYGLIFIALSLSAHRLTFMHLPDLPLSTPSLLFPAISLLMLAYTNRFLGLASVVRGLHASWRATQEHLLLAQIRNLQSRIQIIKHMQTLGVLSLMLCVISMTLLFFDRQTGGQVTFGLSLILMLGSLTLSLVEIQMSGKALDLQLKDVRRDGVME